MPCGGHELRLNLDADAAGAVFLRREDQNTAVARSQVVDQVGRGDLRQPQHRIRDRLRRAGEENVRRPNRLLRADARDGTDNDQRRGRRDRRDSEEL